MKSVLLFMIFFVLFCRSVSVQTKEGEILLKEGIASLKPFGFNEADSSVKNGENLRKALLSLGN